MSVEKGSGEGMYRDMDVEGKTRKWRAACERLHLNSEVPFTHREMEVAILRNRVIEHLGTPRIPPTRNNF
ncbi:MAG TPA: hypothetical protein VLF68_00120 [Candidatus Saccharimonadales bacterium]|nr:hypothetical protein [Candidatus Saccharimonadales bacterium]